MSRRYAQPVQVRTDASDAPVAFQWRGRTYRVSAVLGHWVEGSAWWRRLQRASQGAAGGPSCSLGDRQVWRVEAGSSGSSPGVYDLCCDSALPDGAYRWHLARTLD